jgi:hypothetical protein
MLYYLYYADENKFTLSTSQRGLNIFSCIKLRFQYIKFYPTSEYHGYKAKPLTLI